MSDPASPPASGRPDPPWPPRPPEWRHDAPDPPEAFAVPFRILDGLLLVAWSLAAQLLVQAPFVLAGADFEPSAGLVAIFILSQLVTFGGVVAYLALQGRLSWRLLGPVRPSWRHVGVGVGVGLSGLVVTSVALLLLQTLTGSTEPADQTIQETSLLGGLAAALSLVSLLVAGPVVEEVIFRGVFFQGLRRRLGLWPGIVISSIVWGLVHLEVSALFMAGLMIFGVWLAGAFHRYGSLVVPLVGHAVFNGVSIGLSFLVASPPT